MVGVIRPGGQSTNSSKAREFLWRTCILFTRCLLAMMNPTPQRTRRWRPYLKWGAWALVSIVMLLAVAQITFPFWLAKITPLIAQRFDVEQVTVLASRPGWRGITIQRLTVVSDEYRVAAEGLRVAYSWSGLRRLRMERVEADLLDISIYSSDRAATSAPPKPPLISDLPLDAMIVRSLILRFPDTGFVGRGLITLADDGLSFSMDGQEPDAASALQVAATLTRAGEFGIRIRERSIPDANFLTLTGTLLDETMTVRGDVDLEGFPLRLASEMFGLPVGSGRAVAQFDTTLPWPLPRTVAWRSLVVNLRAQSIDWAADSAQFEVRQLTGEAVWDHGNLQANLGGEVSYVLDGQTLSARLEPMSALSYANDTLQGEAGLSIMGAWDTTQVRADVTSFRLRTDGERRLNLSTGLTVRHGARSGSGHFDIDVALLPPADVGGRTAQGFTVNARLSTPQPAPELIRVEGVWSDGSLSANGRIDLSADTLGFVSSLAGAPAGDGQLSAVFQIELSNASSFL